MDMPIDIINIIKAALKQIPVELLSEFDTFQIIDFDMIQVVSF